MTADEFAASYFSYNRISDARRKRVMATIADFERFTGASIAEITPAAFRDWMADMVERGYHVNTVQKWGRMIRCYVNHAWQMDQLDADRLLRIRAVKDPRGATTQTVPQPYSRAEVRGIYHWVDTAYPLVSARTLDNFEASPATRYRSDIFRHLMNLQLKAVIYLALDCALRRGEIQGATVDDISHHNQFVVVRMGKARISGEPRYREVPFTDKARDAIERWLNTRLWFRDVIDTGTIEHDSPWLTLDPTGQHPTGARQPGGVIGMPGPIGSPMSPDSLRLVFSRSGWRLQRMRHTAATNWLRAGVPLEVVSRLLGHSNIQQTLCYAELNRQDIQRHVTRAEVAFNELMGDRT